MEISKGEPVEKELDKVTVGRAAWTCLALGAATALIGLSIAPWDLYISNFLRTDFFLRGDLGKTIAVSEAFAHGSGVAAILFSLYWIDRSKRRILIVAGTIALCSGILGNTTKVVFPRFRPNAFTEHFQAEISGPADTWLPMLSAAFGDWPRTSFPSGHSATAIGLAVGLTFVYPRGRWIFAALATIACTQRIVAGAHFPSDVFAGATVGFIVSFFVLATWKLKLA